MPTSMKHQLLDVAESLVRDGGYNNFSFRILADTVGIKSASVHYHFPTKADLVAALAKRYSERFQTALGDPQHCLNEGKSPLTHFASLFKNALHHDRKMCLCGMLAVEVDILPESVQQATQGFFKASLDWLTSAFEKECGLSPEHAYAKANEFLALLEGGLMLGKVMDQTAPFDKAIEAFMLTNNIPLPDIPMRIS